MRKWMAGMGLGLAPLMSLGLGVMPQMFFLVALLLGGGNLAAGPATIFTLMAGLAAFGGGFFAAAM